MYLNLFLSFTTCTEPDLSFMVIKSFFDTSLVVLDNITIFNNIKEKEVNRIKKWELEDIAPNFDDIGVSDGALRFIIKIYYSNDGRDVEKIEICRKFAVKSTTLAAVLRLQRDYIFDLFKDFDIIDKYDTILCKMTAPALEKDDICVFLTYEQPFVFDYLFFVFSEDVVFGCESDIPYFSAFMVCEFESKLIIRNAFIKYVRDKMYVKYDIYGFSIRTGFMKLNLGVADGNYLFNCSKYLFFNYVI